VSRYIVLAILAKNTLSLKTTFIYILFLGKGPHINKTNESTINESVISNDIKSAQENLPGIPCTTNDKWNTCLRPETGDIVSHGRTGISSNKL